MNRRSAIRVGVQAGFVGGLAMVAVMLAVRQVAGVLTLPDVLADAVTWLLPIELISWTIDALKYGAKPLFFAGLLVGQIAVAVGLGIVYAFAAQAGVFGGQPRGAGGFPLPDGRGSVPGVAGGEGQPRGAAPTEHRDEGRPPVAAPTDSVVSFAEHLRNGIVWAVGLWLLAMLVLLPLAGAGPFGASLRMGQIGLVLSSLAAFIAYGIGLATAGWAIDAEPVADAPDRSRRRFVGRSLAGALIIATGALAWLALPRTAPAGRAAGAPRSESGNGSPGPAATATGPWAGLTPEVTSNEEFYTVSKNLKDPDVGADSWRLEIAGLVERPRSFTYEELVKLPAREQYATLVCISNEVGGDLIGNALWKGVPLADLLADAGVKSGVKDVVLRAVDDYADSIPLDRALAPGTMLAFEMNGKPLSSAHGFPARLIVPGIYGMKNVKWLSRIELVDHDFEGFWQQRDWSDAAVIRTASRIDSPLDRRRLPVRPTRVGGVAFAGDRGISKVEVSFDGGTTWQVALAKEPLSPYTWTLWTLPWQPPQEGVYRLRVRAYDGAGTVQIAEVRDPLPAGATGYHTIQVNITDEG